MSITRVGQFIEFRGDRGLRNIVRVSAIQWLGDSDETATETWITVANKTLLLQAPLDEVRDILSENGLMIDGRFKATGA